MGMVLVTVVVLMMDMMMVIVKYAHRKSVVAYEVI